MIVTGNGTENTSSEVTDDETPAEDSKAAKASGVGPQVVPDLSGEDPVGADTEDSTTAEAEKSGPEVSIEDGHRRVSISVRGLILSAAIVVLVGAVGVLGWLYAGTRGELDAQTRAATNNEHAEQTALDYAVRAAAMDYKDLNAWKVELVKGTSPELNEKLSKAANDMEQILTPLQWVSTARPLAAKVRSDNGGTYIVDAFVSVMTKTMQAPEGLQSTATYSLTIDSNKDWQISDVGGIGANPGAR